MTNPTWTIGRRRRPKALLWALALVFGIAGSPDLCWAGEPLGPARPGGLPEVLASVTVLSEAAMARESAQGVQSSPVVGDQGGHSRVLLWDELRGPPQILPENSGTVTLSTGGSGK